MEHKLFRNDLENIRSEIRSLQECGNNDRASTQSRPPSIQQYQYQNVNPPPKQEENKYLFNLSQPNDNGGYNARGPPNDPDPQNCQPCNGGGASNGIANGSGNGNGSACDQKDDTWRLPVLKWELEQLKSQLQCTEENARQNECRMLKRMQELENALKLNKEVMMQRECEILDFQGKNKCLSEKLGELQEQCAEQDPFMSLHSNLKEENQKMHQETMKIRKEKAQKEEALQVAKAQETQLQMKIAELQHDKRSLEAEARNLRRNSKKKVQAYKQRSGRKLKHVEDDLRDLRAENADLSEKYRALKREHEDLKPRSDLMSGQLSKEMETFHQKMLEMLEIHVNHLDQIKEGLATEQQSEPMTEDISVNDDQQPQEEAVQEE